MNKKCVAFSEAEYKECISLLRSGFILQGRAIKPNPRIAAICVSQACLGLRLGDVLNLKLENFIRDGDHYRLDIIEEKTGKYRGFTVPTEVYSFLQDYALDNKIQRTTKLFTISARQVERHLNLVFEQMGLPLRSYGTHSLRKYFATRVYMDNEFNIELVRLLLQHSSVAITQRYIGISQKTVEDALAKTSSYLV